MRGGLLLVAAAVMVADGISAAEAGRLAVAQTHAEADLADEAGGFTLLLEAALDRPERPVAPAVELRGVVVQLATARRSSTATSSRPTSSSRARRW